MTLTILRQAARSLKNQTRKVEQIGLRIAGTSSRLLSTTIQRGDFNHIEYTLTPEEQVFYDKGYVDRLGLTVFDTLHEMQVRSCEVFAQNPLFGTYSMETEQFEWMSFAEFGQNVDRCRTVLRDLGVQEHDKVAVISNNRWEWVAIANAAYSLNANLVPMYEAQMPSDWTYIVNDASAKVLFCATQDIYDRVQQEVVPNAPHLEAVLCLNAASGEPHAFATAMENVAGYSSDQWIRPPTQDDLANLIYTSGTTGKPKGVELSHRNFCSNVKSAARSMVENPKDLIGPNDVSLAFLPWAHSFGQTAELWAAMSHGSSMGVCRGVAHIVDDLQMVRPTWLVAVPTLYKKIYDGVNNMMNTASPVRKHLMRSALDIGRRNVDARNAGRSLGFVEGMQFRLLDRLVLGKIRDRFGGRLRFGLSGGAACAPEVIRFLDSVGIEILEGYGLTETAPIIAANSPNFRKVGTVGLPLPGVSVHIINPEDGSEVAQGEEGELCAVGPNVMRGYFNNPDATDEVISTAPDGKSRMFHTGDLARIDEEGYVAVTGRIKEQYKLENGKYVVPTPIEEAIGLSRFISQVVLCGANRPYNVALLVPDWAVIRGALGVDASIADEDLVGDERVKELIDAELATTCKSLKKFETPQQWSLVEPFTIDNDMLTAKLSIRRHKVMAAHADKIGHMYGDDPIVAMAADATGAKDYSTVDEQQQQQQQRAA